ncbi:MAG: type VI secretion system tube protein Hcp [Alphaproteobacteria bacterium]|nr:type VI secretion system tube protein Hcp [Alphaproteobacteria bacterium]
MFRSLAALVGVTLASPAFATDVYLTYPGIQGEVTTQGYTNQIALTSLEVVGFRVAEIGNVAGAGNPKLGEVKATKLTDKASPHLFLESVVGVPNAQDAVFRYVRTGPFSTPPTFYTVTLKSPLVTGYTVSSVNDDPPSETVTFAYDEICIKHQVLNGSGAPSGQPVERCWNAATQTGG